MALGPVGAKGVTNPLLTSTPEVLRLGTPAAEGAPGSPEFDAGAAVPGNGELLVALPGKGGINSSEAGGV